MITPICLFLPYSIFANKYGKEKIAEVRSCTLISLLNVLMTCQSALALGGWKPEILADIEKQIWSVLFDVATGRIEPLEFIRALSTKIPNQQLANVPSDAAGWYNIFSKQTAVPPPATPSVAHTTRTPPVPKASGAEYLRSLIVSSSITRASSLSSVGTPPPISPALSEANRKSI